MARPGIVLTILALLGQPAVAADRPQPLQADDWQEATAADMAVLEPYLGTFRGRTHNADGGGTPFYFSISYSWYDREKTIVKYQLTTHLPDTGEARPLGEGYYRYDRLTDRIAVVGVFRDGRSGSGYLSPFDADAGTREVRILGTAPDGTVNEIRDTFWVIDVDSWGNRTLIRNADGSWQSVSEDIYHRVES